MQFEYKIMRTGTALILLILGFSSEMAWAIHVTNKDELKLLPAFCRGTQTIHESSGDPTLYPESLKMYGPDFQHLHHYCWALNTENKYRKSPTLYFGYLPEAIGDLDYVLAQSKDPNFVFIPDVHLAKARIYLLQRQRGKAAASALQAIAKKPDFVRAYTFLSDLYEDMGNKVNAIKTLESALKHVPDSKPILRRLTRLGVTPPKPATTQSQASEGTSSLSAPAAETGSQNSPISPAPQTDSMAQPTQDAPKLASPPQPEQQTQPGTSQNPKNPYCRFCP